MAVPEGYQLLAQIGFVYREDYSDDITYNSKDVVYYLGSTYVALKDNLTGVIPVNGADWKYMARGFIDELLSLITAVDTSGVLGTAGANVSAQLLMDAIADKVMTKLLDKSQVVNNLLATVPGNPLDAVQGKALKDEIDSTNRNFLSSIRFLTAEETTTASLTWKHYRPRVMCTSSWDGLNSGNCPAENNLWIIVHLPWTQYKSTEDNAITKGYQLWFGIDSKTIYERWLIDENWSEFIQKTF